MVFGFLTILGIWQRFLNTTDLLNSDKILSNCAQVSAHIATNTEKNGDFSWKFGKKSPKIREEKLLNVEVGEAIFSSRFSKISQHRRDVIF